MGHLKTVAVTAIIAFAVVFATNKVDFLRNLVAPKAA